MKYLALLFAIGADMPAPTIDWSFAEAQEAFVIESGGVEAAYRSLPYESQSLLTSMGTPGLNSFRHRDWASREMRRMGIR